jgi:hypothetical protein
MTTLSRPQAAAPPAPSIGYRLRWQEALSAVIAALMTFASLGGLFIDGLYRDNTWSTAAYRGGDLATLLLAVPVLVVALVLARRGSDRARLVWLGVLAYNVYNYAFYLFGTAFNDFFLLYAALEALSLITVAGAISPVLAVPRTARRVPARLVAGYMAVVGAVFAAMWIAQTVRYLTDGTLPKVIAQSGIHTSIVFALDLTLIVPAFLIGAVLLWRGHPAGVVFGVAMNVLGVLYMASLAAAGGFQAHAGISGASWAGPPWIELALTSLAACWLLLHYLTTGASTREAAGTYPQLIPGGSRRRPRER